MSCPVIELTQQLIRRPSLSPDDAGCQALMIERLRAIADGGFKRRVYPAVRITCGNHVGMPGKGQCFALATPRPEILGVAKIHTLHGKTDGTQALNH